MERDRQRGRAFLHETLAYLLPALLWLPQAGWATSELVSASYRLRGAHEASVAARLPSAGPRFSASGVALGQGDALGFSTGATTRSTSVPGFWPLVAGDLPSLDLDGDGLVAWIDDDDDGDGLLDAVESDSGVFVSAADTGTDPALFDSDGDGVGDGEEVGAGSDPNDPGSVPAPPAIPLLPAPLVAVLALMLLAAPRAWHRRTGGSP